MRVLWPHTFSPDIKNASVFMDPLITPLAEQGVVIVPFYIGNIRKNPFCIIDVFSQLRNLAKTCDISHAQYGSLCGLVTAFLPGRKVLSLRGSDLYPVSVGPLSLRARLLVSRLMTYLALPFYDHVVVMSNDMKKRVLLKFPRAEISVIPDGIDLKKFYPMDKAAARNRLGITGSAPQVLYTSLNQASPIKRKNLAQEALSVARRTYPDIQMLVPENVDHDMMPVFVNASDLILCTSTHEGWPNCIKEALACNVPFVATDISDLAEISARQPSCKVAADDPDHLGQAVVAVLNEKRGDHLRGEAELMEVSVSAGALRGVYEALLGKDS